jgi:hypothetical protein
MRHQISRSYEINSHLSKNLLVEEPDEKTSDNDSDGRDEVLQCDDDVIFLV